MEKYSFFIRFLIVFGILLMLTAIIFKLVLLFYVCINKKQSEYKNILNNYKVENKNNKLFKVFRIITIIGLFIIGIVLVLCLLSIILLPVSFFLIILYAIEAVDFSQSLNFKKSKLITFIIDMLESKNTITIISFLLILSVFLVTYILSIMSLHKSINIYKKLKDC